MKCNRRARRRRPVMGKGGRRAITLEVPLLGLLAAHAVVSL
ncbi:hypothetical protein SF06_04450 [Pseudomonas flexibilis]|nr:hypothetical protein SF06_04450 [Pseudomonas flexibilis]